jgi:hypothetical protein
MPAPPEILELIERFDRNLRSYKKSPYNEAQACNIARRNPQVCPVGRLPAPVGLAERLVRGRRRGEAKGPDREGTKGAKECATARALRVLRDASRLRDPNTVALQRRIEVKDRQVDALHSAPQCRLGAGEEGRGGMLTRPKRLHQCNAPFVGWRSGRSPALPPGLPAQVVLAPHHVTGAASQPCAARTVPFLPSKSVQS